MAYVYRHIRIDKNVPFYIGMGVDNGYHRANQTSFNRNRFWKNIAAKTKVIVEIMVDNISWQEACKKETEFILLYGRRDLGKGSLVNLTDGGETNPNRIMQEETKIKIGNANRGRKFPPISEETRAKKRLFRHTEEAKERIKKQTKISRTYEYPFIHELIKDYQSNQFVLVDIMKKYSIGRNTITRLMKRYGVALNSEVNAKRISLDELNSVKDKGMTLKQLSEYFCMSYTQMTREIKRHDMYIRQPNNAPLKVPYQFRN